MGGILDPRICKERVTLLNDCCGVGWGDEVEHRKDWGWDCVVYCLVFRPTNFGLFCKYLMSSIVLYRKNSSLVPVVYLLIICFLVLVTIFASQDEH